jgi:hypothetical protein
VIDEGWRRNREIKIVDWLEWVWVFFCEDIVFVIDRDSVKRGEIEII